MKQTLYAVALLLLVGIAPLRAQSRFSIAPTYSVAYGYYSNTLNLSGVDFISYSHLYGPSYGTTVGATGRYAFTPALDVSVGLLYNRMTTYYQIDTKTYTPFMSTTQALVRATGFEDNVQLPVALNYRLSSKRLSPYFSAGALFSYQLGQHNKLTDKHAIGTSALVGAGVSYRINPSLSLIVQPTGSYLFQNASVLLPPDGQQQIRSYQIGLQTQLVVHF